MSKERKIKSKKKKKSNKINTNTHKQRHRQKNAESVKMQWRRKRHETSIATSRGEQPQEPEALYRAERDSMRVRTRERRTQNSTMLTLSVLSLTQ